VNGEAPITVLLHAWRDGDPEALDRLIPIVYPELRRLARASLRRGERQHTIDPTALVHEAYLRLVATGDHNFASRTHFMAVAARVMRTVLVDRARARYAAKRKAGYRVTLNLELDVCGSRPAMVVALDDALTDLAKQDAGKAHILELRYFGGLTAEQSAEVLGLSVHQVNRQIRMAQAWLRRALDGQADEKIQKAPQEMAVESDLFG
jgi:RNA polymerase sigma factor (TIGR02999 family)